MLSRPARAKDPAPHAYGAHDVMRPVPAGCMEGLGERGEGPSTGSVIWNEVPTPGSLSTVILPPWASTTSFTIFVPSPVPPTLRLIAWYVKRLSRTSGDIPFPVSTTDRTMFLRCLSV